MFRMLHALLHDTEAVAIKGSYSLHMSAHNLRADFQRLTLVPHLTAVLMQLSYQYRQGQCTFIAVQALKLAVVALKTTDNRVLDIMCLTWDEWS